MHAIRSCSTRTRGGSFLYRYAILTTEAHAGYLESRYLVPLIVVCKHTFCRYRVQLSTVLNSCRSAAVLDSQCPPKITRKRNLHSTPSTIPTTRPIFRQPPTLLLTRGNQVLGLSTSTDPPCSRLPPACHIRIQHHHHLDQVLVHHHHLLLRSRSRQLLYNGSSRMWTRDKNPLPR